MQKFYAVKAKETSFIASSWEEAKSKMMGLTSISQKSFSNYEDALAFITNSQIERNVSDPTAYIDGSYDSITESYSFGGVLLIDGKEQTFYKKYPKDDYSAMHNVAGEIKGAGYIINYAVNHGFKKLHLYYDYLGIEKWYLGLWQAKSPIAIEYTKFRETVKNKIEVVFHKVKSHTNDKYNEMADKLAKKALGI